MFPKSRFIVRRYFLWEIFGLGFFTGEWRETWGAGQTGPSALRVVCLALDPCRDWSSRASVTHQSRPSSLKLFREGGVKLRTLVTKRDDKEKKTLQLFTLKPNKHRVDTFYSPYKTVFTLFHETVCWYLVVRVFIKSRWRFERKFWTPSIRSK